MELLTNVLVVVVEVVPAAAASAATAKRRYRSLYFDAQSSGFLFHRQERVFFF